MGVKSTLDSCCIMTQKSIMSRPLRIQYAGAWCHVMNRVRRGEEVPESRFLSPGADKIFELAKK